MENESCTRDLRLTVASAVAGSPTVAGRSSAKTACKIPGILAICWSSPAGNEVCALACALCGLSEGGASLSTPSKHEVGGGGGRAGR